MHANGKARSFELEVKSTNEALATNTMVTYRGRLGSIHKLCRGGTHAYVKLWDGAQELFHVPVAELTIVPEPR